jgi:hypothetical protein
MPAVTNPRRERMSDEMRRPNVGDVAFLAVFVCAVVLAAYGAMWGLALLLAAVSP